MSQHDFIGALEPLIITVAVIIGVTLADLEIWFRILSIALTMSYAMWKFRTDYKDRKNKKKDGHTNDSK